jgi:hypothetical protein
MGQFSVEKPVALRSALSGNQQILNSQLVGISANRPGRVVLMMIPILGRFCIVAFLDTYDW